MLETAPSAMLEMQHALYEGCPSHAGTSPEARGWVRSMTVVFVESGERGASPMVVVVVVLENVEVAGPLSSGHRGGRSLERLYPRRGQGYR